MSIPSGYKVPVGYRLSRDPEQCSIINEVLSEVAAGKFSYRKAAKILRDRLDRGVSHEWVRLAVMNRRREYI